MRRITGGFLSAALVTFPTMVLTGVWYWKLFAVSGLITLIVGLLHIGNCISEKDRSQ